ncbi:MAG: porin family protein, partial [Spirochaetota bacterium]|nr:porin family protein [Spirochaetota bacterium]
SCIPLFGLAETPDRDQLDENAQMSWYIGVGFGYPGYVDQVVDKVRIKFDDLTHYTAMFRVGARINPHLLMGLESIAYNVHLYDEKTFSFTGDRVRIETYFMVATYFPFKDGFFAKAGGGISRMNVSMQNSVEDYFGTGFVVGTGYALKAGKYFHLTLNADFSRQYYLTSPGKPSQSNLIHAYLGFEWF